VLIFAVSICCKRLRQAERHWLVSLKLWLSMQLISQTFVMGGNMLGFSSSSCYIAFKDTMGGESSLYGVKKYIQHFGKEKS
jgi:hypothetical protein